MKTLVTLFAVASSDLLVPQHHANGIHAAKPHAGKDKGPDIALERSPLTCDCPDGFNLRDERCEREVESPLEQICPIGFRLLSNQCVRERTPSEVCPFGFARVRNDCIRREIVIPELSCPTNFNLEFAPNMDSKFQEMVCAARVSVDSILECPNGSPFRGVCESRQAQPAQFMCPAGFTNAAANSCNRVERVECAAGGKHSWATAGGHAPHPPHRKLEAEEETMTGASAGGEGKGGQVVHAGWDGEVARAAQVGIAATGPTNLRQAGFKPWVQVGRGGAGLGNGQHHSTGGTTLEVEQTCTTNVTIPARAYCEIGQLKGQVCLVPTPVEPVTVCPAFGTPSNCFAIERQSPRSVCPENFQEECTTTKVAGHHHIACECVKTETVAVALECQPGSTLQDGICRSMTTPHLGCSLTNIQNGNVCISTELAAPMCRFTIDVFSNTPAAMGGKKNGLLNTSSDIAMDLAALASDLKAALSVERGARGHQGHGAGWAQDGDSHSNHQGITAGRQPVPLASAISTDVAKSFKH